MLKILKLLYYIEKPRNALERIRITDILAKPQPGNIITDDSMTTIYGDVFQKLYDKIRSAVADADFRCSALMSIDREWRYISLQTFNHLLSPQALKFPQESYEELYRIKDFLTKIHIKLNDISDEQRTRPEGVMNTFFNILACHKFLCMENGKIAVNTQVSQVTPPNPSYIEKFKEIQTLDPASWSILERLHNNLDAKSSDDNANFILRMAAYDSDIPDDDITSYRYAVEHVRTVADWWYNYLQIEEKSIISIDTLCVIIQEIFYCRKNTPQISHNYMGQSNEGVSMMGALSHPKEADPVVITAWMVRLENRLCANYGVSKQLQLKREIENLIFEIKKIIYSYHNLYDLLFVNSFLTFWAAKTTIPRHQAIECGNNFLGMVLAYINIPDNHSLQLRVSSPNVLNFFREFPINTDDFTQIEAAAKYIASSVVQACNSSHTNVFQLRVTFRLLPPPHPMSSNECCLILKIDKNTDTIELLDYRNIISNEYEAEMERLGLEAFIVD